jgi:hypothetical protein
MRQATSWVKQLVLENVPLILEADTCRCVMILGTLVVRVLIRPKWSSSTSATYVLAMKQATISAKQLVLERGPRILEAVTYRYVMMFCFLGSCMKQLLLL